MQIYDCEIGVGVLLFNLDTKLQSNKATSVYPVNIGNYAVSSVILKPKLFKSSQKSGYEKQLQHFQLLLAL
jgi:hypothetical protein